MSIISPTAELEHFKLVGNTQPRLKISSSPEMNSAQIDSLVHTVLYRVYICKRRAPCKTYAVDPDVPHVADPDVQDLADPEVPDIADDWNKVLTLLLKFTYY
jgi:hypothetical protein